MVRKMNIIRQKRKKLGLSQSELSEKLGTSQQTISRIEKAEIENIPCNLLIKLADIFHVLLIFLFTKKRIARLVHREKNYGKYTSNLMQQIRPLY